MYLEEVWGIWLYLIDIKFHNHIHTTKRFSKSKCPKCEYSCFTKQDLSRHIVAMHEKCIKENKESQKMEAHKKKIPKEKKKFKCKIFKIIENKESQRFSKSKCPQCEYSCFTKQDLGRHIVAVHEKCIKENKESKKMEAHKETLHEEKKKFKCKICKNFYPTKSNLNKHHLRRHIKSVQDKILSNVTSCDIKKSELKSHEVKSLRHQIESVHDGNKFFRCTICSEAFTGT